MNKILAGTVIWLLSVVSAMAQPVPQTGQTQIAGSWTQTARIADISATNASSDTTFGATRGPIVAVYNIGSKWAYVKLATASTTVTAAAGAPVPPGSCIFLNAVSQSHIAAITAGSDTTTLQVSVGAGFPGSCGGGGSSSGGGSVTQGTTPWIDSISYWNGVALGSPSSYGTSPGAVSVPGVNAFVTNTVPVSAVSWPLPTDAATQTTLASILTNLGSPFQAGGSIGNASFGISGTLPAFAATPTFNPGNTANTTPWLTRTNDGTNSILLDPCQTVTKSNVAISQTANTKLISGTSAKKTYICSIFIVGADAENLSLVEGTGSVCASSTAAVIGATTAANGPNFSANNGWAQGNGAASIAIASAVNADDVCLFQSGSGRVAGNVIYVQQ